MVVDRLEGQLEPFERQLPDGSRRAGRICQRERDGDPHVGKPDVRQQGAVTEADERVDDRRRVHDDLDRLVRDAE